MVCRFFDFSKTVAKRAFRVIQVLAPFSLFEFWLFSMAGMRLISCKISLTFFLGIFPERIQDTHNVRSVSFHPSGEFLLAGIHWPSCAFFSVDILYPESCPNIINVRLHMIKDNILLTRISKSMIKWERNKKRANERKIGVWIEVLDLILSGFFLLKVEKP